MKKQKKCPPWKRKKERDPRRKKVFRQCITLNGMPESTTYETIKKKADKFVQLRGMHRFQRKQWMYIFILWKKIVCNSHSSQLQQDGDEQLKGQGGPDDSKLEPRTDNVGKNNPTVDWERQNDSEKTLEGAVFVVITIIRRGQFIVNNCSSSSEQGMPVEMETKTEN
jgi:hypothetical protein